jgi:hypothetical protein
VERVAVAIDVGQKVRHLIADPQERRSIGTYLRKRRWELFRKQFPDIEQMHVLDLGGVTVHWKKFPIKPLSVTVVNLLPQDSVADSITAIQGDVCNEIPELRGKSFDLVYSNSLIEHVGGHARRADFAANVNKFAPHHWVQTPYRYFPIEPHWLFPGLQFLPQAMRAKAIRHWPLSPSKPTRESALAEVLEIELLSRAEMKYYFDQSRILSERVLGITKSLIAVR